MSSSRSTGASSDRPPLGNPQCLVYQASLVHVYAKARFANGAGLIVLNRLGWTCLKDKAEYIHKGRELNANICLHYALVHRLEHADHRCSRHKTLRQRHRYKRTVVAVPTAPTRNPPVGHTGILPTATREEDIIMTTSIRKAGLLSAIVLTGPLIANTAFGANYGTDLNLTMMPAAGGMGGVGIARPQGNASALFGNPATLDQYNQGTRFTFGAAFYVPKVRDSHNGSVTGTAWSANSHATNYLIPNVAITQPLGPRSVLGIGVGVISGIGSDFRGTPGSLDPASELLLFGANIGYAYQINPHLSLGAAVTLGDGYLQAGLVENGASVHGFGLRGTIGADYTVGATTVGAYYRSPLSIRYHRLIKYGPDQYYDATVEQPQEVGVGIANSTLLNGNLLLAADVVWKNWGKAKFYRDIYDNQTVFAVGAQLKQGPVKWRVGYSHAKSPIKGQVGNSIGGIHSAVIGGTANVPFNSAVVQYLQATNVEVVWVNQVTLGVGYQFTPVFSVDAHVAAALPNSQSIGGTTVDARAWQIAAGLNWQF